MVNTFFTSWIAAVDISTRRQLQCHLWWFFSVSVLSCGQELPHQPAVHFLKEVFEKNSIEIDCTHKTHWPMTVAFNLLRKMVFETDFATQKTVFAVNLSCLWFMRSLIGRSGTASMTTHQSVSSTADERTLKNVQIDIITPVWDEAGKMSMLNNGIFLGTTLLMQNLLASWLFMFKLLRTHPSFFCRLRLNWARVGNRFGITSPA